MGRPSPHLVLALLGLAAVGGGDPHLARCADPICQAPISVGRTTVRNHGRTPEMLSFKPDETVTVFSKDDSGSSAGDGLWGVEINGRRGFVNKRHIMETRVIQRNTPHRVPLNRVFNPDPMPQHPAQQQQQQPMQQHPQQQEEMRQPPPPEPQQQPPPPPPPQQQQQQEQPLGEEQREAASEGSRDPASPSPNVDVKEPAAPSVPSDQEGRPESVEEPKAEAVDSSSKAEEVLVEEVVLDGSEHIEHVEEHEEISESSQQQQQQQAQNVVPEEPSGSRTNDSSSADSASQSPSPLPSPQGESLPPPTPVPLAPKVDVAGLDGSDHAAVPNLPPPPAMAQSPPPPPSTHPQAQAPSPQPEILSSMAVESPTPLPLDASFMGAHSTQINLSPEDMEFNRLKTTYAVDDKDTYALEEALNNLVTTTASMSSLIDAPTAATVSLFTTVSAESALPQAEEGNYEIFDGTTLFLDKPPNAIDSSPMPTQDLKVEPVTHINPTMTQSADISASKSEEPEILSSTVVPQEQVTTEDTSVEQETPQPEGGVEPNQGVEEVVQGTAVPVATPSVETDSLPIENSATPKEVLKQDDDGEVVKPVQLDPQVEKIEENSQDSASGPDLEAASSPEAEAASSPEAEAAEVEDESDKEEVFDEGDYPDYDGEEDEEEQDLSMEQEDAEDRKQFVQQQLEANDGSQTPTETDTTTDFNPDTVDQTEPAQEEEETASEQPEDNAVTEAPLAEEEPVPILDEGYDQATTEAASSSQETTDAPLTTAEIPEAGDVVGEEVKPQEASVAEPQVDATQNVEPIAEEAPAVEGEKQEEGFFSSMFNMFEDGSDNETESTQPDNQPIENRDDSTAFTTESDLPSDVNFDPAKPQEDIKFHDPNEFLTQQQEDPYKDEALYKPEDLPEIIPEDNPVDEQPQEEPGVNVELPTEAQFDVSDGGNDASVTSSEEPQPSENEAEATTEAPFAAEVAPPPEDNEPELVQQPTTEPQQLWSEEQQPETYTEQQPESNEQPEWTYPDASDPGASSQYPEEDAANTDEEDMVQHYSEAASDFLPEWLIHALHADGGGGVSPKLAVLTFSAAFLFLGIFLVMLVVQQCSNEAPLKQKLAKLDEELYKVRNESKIVKREADQKAKKAAAEAAAAAESAAASRQAHQQPQTIVRNEPPEHLLAELEELRADNAALRQGLESGSSGWQAEREELERARAAAEAEAQEARQEVEENADFIARCLEERKQQEKIAAMVDTLRKELRTQQESVVKNEARVKKRESELKEKTQELRKLNVEAANAKLQVTKLTARLDEVKKQQDAFESATEEREREQKELAALKQKYYKVVEDVETKDSELETKTRELDIALETVEQLKAVVSNGNGKAATAESTGEDTEDGWDCEDALVSDIAPDLSAIEETAKLKVDLRKAQEACEKLTTQLMESDETREQLEKKATECMEEVDIARKAKDRALHDKVEMENKLEVLKTYFNQRESDLQKELGMTANKLCDTATSSQDAKKVISSQSNEIEMLREKIKSLEKELFETERSLKAQNESLEHKQHESWVSQRQEARKSAEAQMQNATLRTRLTVVESQMVEKDLELSKREEEIEGLKSAVEKLTRASLGKQEPVFTNGNNTSASSSINNDPASPASSTSAVAPDLPPLPMLPTLAPMTMAPPPVAPAYMAAPYLHNYGPAAPPPPPHHPSGYHHPPDVRPAPLGGRRSPPPNTSDSGDDYYRGNYSREDSPEGIRNSRGRYDSGRSYDRYSRERSPDRVSNRSGRSDRSSHSRYD